MSFYLEVRTFAVVIMKSGGGLPFARDVSRYDPVYYIYYACMRAIECLERPQVFFALREANICGRSFTCVLTLAHEHSLVRILD